MLGTPYFDQVKLHLENGKTVTIIARNQERQNRYVAALTLNGTDYNKNFVTHDDLLAGATFDYTMAAEPNTQRGTSLDAVPYSFTNELAAEQPVKKAKKAKKSKR